MITLKHTEPNVRFSTQIHQQCSWWSIFWVVKFIQTGLIESQGTGHLKQGTYEKKWASGWKGGVTASPHSDLFSITNHRSRLYQPQGFTLLFVLCAHLQFVLRLHSPKHLWRSMLQLAYCVNYVTVTCFVHSSKSKRTLETSWRNGSRCWFLMVSCHLMRPTKSPSLKLQLEAAVAMPCSTSGSAGPFVWFKGLVTLQRTWNMFYECESVFLTWPSLVLV